MEQKRMPQWPKDYGPGPAVVNVRAEALKNRAYRRALWTGPDSQLVLMHLRPGEDIGMEVHPYTDQILRIEQGTGQVSMGRSERQIDIRRRVGEGDTVFVPGGTWHNIQNTGKMPLKLTSIYAPPRHPHGTYHPNKAFAMEAEKYY